MGNARGVFMVVASAAICAGCAASTVDNDFLCDAPIGTPCASIAESDGREYAAAGAGGSVAGGGQHERSSPALGREGVSRNANLRRAATPIPFEDPPHVAGVPQAVIAGGELYGSEAVNPVLFREPERVTSVWIAPFVGENGYLYQPGFVHFVVEQGRWFGPGGVAGGIKAPNS